MFAFAQTIRAIRSFEMKFLIFRRQFSSCLSRLAGLLFFSQQKLLWELLLFFYRTILNWGNILPKIAESTKEKNAMRFSSKD